MNVDNGVPLDDADAWGKAEFKRLNEDYEAKRAAGALGHPKLPSDAGKWEVSPTLQSTLSHIHDRLIQDERAMPERQESVDPALVRSVLGLRSLADVPATSAPPLLLDHLDAEGSTILFGTGGVGKGLLACWWAVQLVAKGHRVLIVDYESHGSEWARRIRALGGQTALDGVEYVAPGSREWTEDRGPIWKQVAALDQAIRVSRATYLVIDSIVFACAGHDPMKPEMPIDYDLALQYLDRPSLSLGHVTRESDMRYPFGSIFWHNGARTTWSMKGDGPTRSILAHRKHNNHAYKGNYVVNSTWVDDLPREVVVQGYLLHLDDRIHDALGIDWLTQSEIKARLSDDEIDGEPVKADSVRKALERGIKKMPQRFTVREDEGVSRYHVAV
jgi:hypothetical protein